VAGLWVKPTITTSYLVRQEICGNVKWDLVTVHQSATSLAELEMQNQNLKVYPQPTTDELNLSFDVKDAGDFDKIKIYNSIGQLIRIEEIEFVDRNAIIKINNLPDGVYVLKLTDKNNFEISKRFVIAR